MNISRKTLRRIFLPAIIFQSVGMGGAFATGREIVQYMARFGTLGIIPIAIYLVSLAIFGSIIYEFARMFDLYDYKSLLEGLIGRFWPIFEILYIILSVLFMASFLSAGGIVLQKTIGISGFWASVGFAIFIAGILYYGRSVIERFSTVGTILIYIVFVVMFLAILSQRWGHVVTVFSTGNTSYVSDISIVSVVKSGILYSGYTLIVFIPVLFTIDELESRRQAFLTGTLSSVLLNIPVLLTYLSVMGYYPDESIVDAPLPWFSMLQEYGSNILIGLYILVLSLTFIETGVGYVHSIVDRINENLKENNYAFLEDRSALSARQRGLFAGAVILSSLLLSRFGIIAIVSQGYSIMAYLFIGVFAFPLLTVGLVSIFRPAWKDNAISIVRADD